MLSILIPIYNYDVRSLVEDLFHQCKDQNIEFEIVCMDDASDPSYRQLNAKHIESDKIRYVDSVSYTHLTLPTILLV